VHFGGDVSLAQCEIEGDGVFRWDECVGGGAEEESWRGGGGDVEFVGERFGERGIGRSAEKIFCGAAVRVFGGHGDDGIGEDDEVGAAIFAVDGIGVGCVAGVEVGGERGGKVASGGEAHEAELRGIDVEFPGAAADEADGALRVAEFDGMVVTRAEAILQDECGDAHGVEPIGDLAAFVVGGEVMIAAAGGDDDSGGGFVVVSGGIVGERGNILVGVAEGTGGGLFPEAEGVEFGGGVDARVGRGVGLRRLGLRWRCLSLWTRERSDGQERCNQERDDFQGADSPEGEFVTSFERRA
jgi:hypothetical protein